MIRFLLAIVIAASPSITAAQCYVDSSGQVRCQSVQRAGLFGMRRVVVDRPATTRDVVRYRYTSAAPVRSYAASSGSYSSAPRERLATPEEERAHAVEVLSRPENRVYAAEHGFTLSQHTHEHDCCADCPCDCEDCCCGDRDGLRAEDSRRVKLAELPARRVRLAELPPRMVRLAELPSKGAGVVLAMR